MLEYIGILVMILGIYIWNKMNTLYNKAKEKHRKEFVELYFFVGKYYISTGIVMRRCYMSLFSMFEQMYMGFIFEGVQVVVFDNKGNILICKKEQSRCATSTYDIGAGGMVAYPNSVEQTAREELFEELGVCTNVEKVTTVTPYHGYNCIIHIYKTIINDEKLVSVDNTYVEFEFYDCKNIKKEIFNEIKYDGKLMIRNLITV
jgi:hypothetical protein